MEFLQQLEGQHPKSVMSIAISPDGKTFASCSPGKLIDYGVINIWTFYQGEFDLVTNSHILSEKSYALPGNSTVDFSSDGQSITYGSSNNDVKVYSLESRTVTKTFSGHSSNSWRGVCFDPTSPRVVSSNRDGTIRVWSLKNKPFSFITGSQLLSIPTQDYGVNTIRVDTNGKILAGACSDRSIRIWDLNTGELLRTLTGYSANVRALTIFPEQELIASVTVDDTVRIWDFVTGETVSVLSEHSNGIISVAVSPDSKILAVGDSDKKVTLWNLHTGEVGVIRGFPDYVFSLAITTNVITSSRILLVGCGGGTIVAWKLSF